MEYKNIPVDPTVHKRFKDHCKKKKIGIGRAANLVFDGVVERNMNPKRFNKDTRESVGQKVARYHDYTAGFLTEFERKMEAFFEKRIEQEKQFYEAALKILEGNTNVNAETFRTVMACLYILDGENKKNPVYDKFKDRFDQVMKDFNK